MPTSTFLTANDFAGADLGAKINTALAALGGRGEVVVAFAADQSIDTPVTVGVQQRVRFQPGTYNQRKPITLNGNGASVVGAGEYVTSLLNTGSHEPSVVVRAGGHGNHVCDLYLARDLALTPAPTAVGISATGTVLDAVVRNVNADHHYVGLVLGQTSRARVTHCAFVRSVSDGIRIVNSATSHECQWHLDGITSGDNGGAGLSVVSKFFVGGPKFLAVGAWTNFNTWRNRGAGISVAADFRVPIQGVRLFGGFLGEDRANEIYFNSYGGGHSVRDVTLELALHNGIEITAHNADVSVTGCRINRCQRNGILTSAANTLIAGCDITNCGEDLKSPQGRSGIYVFAGSAVVTGNRSGNAPDAVGWTTGLAQQYGVYCVPTNVTVTGNRLHGNGTAAIGGSPAVQTGNLTN